MVGGLQNAGSVVVVHRVCSSMTCGIFLDQASNLCPLLWQADSSPLDHQRSTPFLKLGCLISLLSFKSVPCHLTLLLFVFCIAKLLNLMKYNLSVISIIHCVFDIVSKKSSLYLTSSRFSTMLSLRSFIFCLLLRPLIHFELFSFFYF